MNTDVCHHAQTQSVISRAGTISTYRRGYQTCKENLGYIGHRGDPAVAFAPTRLCVLGPAEWVSLEKLSYWRGRSLTPVDINLLLLPLKTIDEIS